MSEHHHPGVYKVLLDAIGMGIACGLAHPCEWYINAVRSLAHRYPYPEIPKRELALHNAFAWFLPRCACAPDDPLAGVTRDNLEDFVSDWLEHRPKAGGAP
jgi:hypothetical protein